MKLSREEQETTITYCAADDVVSISTAYPPDIAYYDKLCKTRPEFIKCTHRRDPYVFYEATKRLSALRLKAPPKRSEKQMEQMAQARRRSQTPKTPQKTPSLHEE